MEVNKKAVGYRVLKDLIFPALLGVLVFVSLNISKYGLTIFYYYGRIFSSGKTGVELYFVQSLSYGIFGFAVVGILLRDCYQHWNDKSYEPKLKVATILCLLIMLVTTSEYFRFKYEHYLPVIPFSPSEKIESVETQLGTFGDFFGGVLNPILTFVTILILLIQFRSNEKREDERDLREDLRDQREDERDKRAAELRLEILARERERDNKEAARDKKDTDREIFEHQKYLQELFLRKIDQADNKLQNVLYNNEQGHNALISFLGQAKNFSTDPHGLRFSISGYHTATAQILAYVRIVNSLFKYSIRPMFKAPHDRPVLLLSNTTFYMEQYEFLTSHFPEALLVQLSEFLKSNALKDLPFNKSKHANYILSFSDYFVSEKLQDYPELIERESLERIFLQAEKAESE